MNKSTKILLGILIVLGAIYAVERMTSTSSTTEKSKPLSTVDTARVQQITIDFGKKIVFNKQGNLWMIVAPINFPADRGQVNLFLSRIGSNPSASVVADNMSDSSAYGLGSGAPLVTFGQGNGKMLSLRVGNLTPDFNGCYIQVLGENKVLELSANIRTLAGQTLTNWRDKKIFSFNLDSIKTVDFAIGDTLYHFLHRDTLWQVNGVHVPEMKARDVVESLIGSMALDFIDSSVSSPKALVEYGILLSNGGHVAGKIFELAESEGSRPWSGQVCLSNSANSQIYVISSMLPEDMKQELREIREAYLTKKSS